MKIWFRILVICLSLRCLQAAGIEGIVVNATTGKPEPAVTVNLVQPQAGGMQILSSVQSGRDGKFTINNEIQPGRVALLQALYQGATYNLVLQPGVPASGLRLTIYKTTAKPDIANVAEHLLVLQPAADAIRIDETLLMENSSQLTFLDAANGSIQFYVPPSFIGQLMCTVKAPDGMPIRRPVEKTAGANIFKVNYPLKPGETRFDLTYSVPSANFFAGRNLYTDIPTRLVTPPTVTLSSESIDSMGQEPASEAHLYSVRASSYEVKIVSTGSLAGEDPEQPSVQESSARLYTRLPWVLGLLFGVLIFGGYLLFQRGSAKTMVDQVFAGLTIATTVALVWTVASSLQPLIIDVGARAPAFSVVTERGKTLSPAQFGGKLLVLNFWATWCEGCVEETASLNRFQKELADRGVVVVAVSVDRNDKRYRRFVDVFHLGFETLRDPEAESGLAARYGTFQFPETYVIDSSGRVALKIVGAQNFVDPDFVSRIQKML